MYRMSSVTILVSVLRVKVFETYISSVCCEVLESEDFLAVTVEIMPYHDKILLSTAHCKIMETFPTL